jgi:hypothetical protein
MKNNASYVKTSPLSYLLWSDNIVKIDDEVSIVATAYDNLSCRPLFAIQRYEDTLYIVVSNDEFEDFSDCQEGFSFEDVELVKSLINQLYDGQITAAEAIEG